MDETRLFISNFEIKDAWRLFSKILFFVPILLFVAGINIYVDFLGFYSKPVNDVERPEYHIAQALLKGKNVDLLLEDKDDRLIQKYFIENMTVAPDMAILGSSRSMWLGENIAPEKRVINNSVLNITLADYLGIFEGYAKKNLYPKKVICELDPHLTVSPVTSQRWVSIKEDTLGMLQKLGIHSQKIKPPVIPQAWRNLFSFNLFQNSIYAFGHQDISHNYRVTEAETGKILIFKDGRRLWETNYLRDTQKNRQETLRELNDGSYVRSLNHKRPDKELGAILEDFIRYLRDHHVQVTLYLLPLHPQLYKNLLDSPNRPGDIDIVSFEQYYRDLAHRLNVKIIGSYDPAACNLADTDYYDVQHIRNEVIEKLFKQKGTQCSMPGV